MMCDVRGCPNPGTVIRDWHYVCATHMHPPEPQCDECGQPIDAGDKVRAGLRSTPFYGTEPRDLTRGEEAAVDRVLSRPPKPIRPEPGNDVS